MASIARSAGRRERTSASGLAGMSKRSSRATVRFRWARQRMVPNDDFSKPWPMARFSATERSGKTAGFWWTKCRPRARAAAGVVWSARISSPSTMIVPPASALYTPAMILMRVDLPDPLPPTRAWIWPRWTSNETSIRARVPGNVLDTWLTRSATSEGDAAGVPVVSGSGPVTPAGGC